MISKISILMTVYNTEKYLTKSIKSILSQKFENFEFIIVDDCSTDNSQNIIKNLKDKRIKFYSLKKRFGRTKALNFGLNKCNTSFIAVQDADDVSHPDRLTVCLKKLNYDKSIGLIGTNFSFIDSNDIEETNLNNLHKLRKKIDNLKFINFIPHSSIIFDRNKLEKNILYDTSFVYAQDYHLILKYLKNSKISLLDEKLVQIRKHEDNMTNNKKIKKIRIEENIRLLDFCLKNFTLSYLERRKIYIYKVKNRLSLLCRNLNIIN